MLSPYTAKEKAVKDLVKDEACSDIKSSTGALDVPEGMPTDELFKAIMSSSPIGMYITQDGEFQFISRKFAEILGYSQDELMGSEALNYVCNEDRDMVRTKATEALKSGQCQPYEYRVITKTGEFKWILETVISIQYMGRRSTLGNFMDITERKLAQEEMRQTNEKLTLLIKKFEKQNHFNSILTEMRDLLQACSTIEEITPIIMSSMKNLFPRTEGALFLMSSSKSDLESVARWGGFSEDIDDNVFAPGACWGLRRGHAHVVNDADIGPICPHLKHKLNTAYICLPLMAKGDVLGLLHLRSEQSISSPDKQQKISELKDMAVTISEYLSLAIANVKLSERLSKQSVQDPLSGLYNRRYMEESLEHEIQRAIRKHTQIGIVMADIDHFKEFNDMYGHAAGDMAINLIGKLFKQGIRGTDIACRYGGEEFILIFPDCSLEDTFKRAENLREEIKKLQIIFQGQLLGSITVSMGAVTYPVYGVNMNDLLRTADIALYQAKQAGRDRVASGQRKPEY